MSIGNLRESRGGEVGSTPLPMAIEAGIELERIDPSRNMRRYYRFSYQQDLFGQWLLVRQWGRIGRSAQFLATCVDGPDEAVREAVTIALAKLRKGYRLRSRQGRGG